MSIRNLTAPITGETHANARYILCAVECVSYCNLCFSHGFFNLTLHLCLLLSYQLFHQDLTEILLMFHHFILQIMITLTVSTAKQGTNKCMNSEQQEV